MNERIHELAEKALNKSNLKGSYIPEEFLENFGELIVIECALLCLEDKDSQCILNHFGVKK